MASERSFEPGKNPAGFTIQSFDEVKSTGLRVAVLDPDGVRRAAVWNTLKSQEVANVAQFASCPRGPAEFSWFLSQGFDLVLIEIESNAEATLRMVEGLCALSPITVMVYGASLSEELLLRSMRAGAREYLPLPFSPAVLRLAIQRTAIRLQRQPVPVARNAGQIFAFTGSKGGTGVTTICSNFAVALARETGARTLLVDLNLPLGDVGLTLRVGGPYSVADALREEERLDSTFFSKLLARHDSGLMVLPAPNRMIHEDPADTAIDRLFTVACLDFDYVVVDGGLRLDLARKLLFDRANQIFLVTQIGVSELRNCNRLITGWLNGHRDKLSVVVNRYSAYKTPIDDSSIERALTVPIAWRVPNDFKAMMRLENDAIPLVEDDTLIARVLRSMARAAAGIKETDDKRSTLTGLRALFTRTSA